ncbi:MAG: hypothetical protein Q8P92_00815 [Candidatus Daviesbacteria bacterium]|nr:hypothetical protein [Candidatus Daviesbacteria bacterium]
MKDSVIPADAGIQLKSLVRNWIPAYAGMTREGFEMTSIRAPELDVGMLLNINGRKERVASVKKLDPPAGGWIEEEVPVEQIQPGDEILSLNEKTGQFEWHQVEQALFKGIQDLYELITSQGKRIRTTKEHPYYIKIIGNSNQDLRGSPQYQSVRGKPLTDGKWLKVQNIKEGMLIATIDGWETVSSINKVKRQRVYDLQIENTHNFLANDIVAHNTYLMGGNIGIGWTSPSQLFQINPTYVGTQLTNPLPFTVTSAGNVGIGTTAPRSALDILGGSLLQTPQNPTYVGGNSTTNEARDVFVNGKYAYVVTNTNAGACSSSSRDGCELQIYDVTNSNAPVFIGGSDTADNEAETVFVSGRYAYVGLWNFGGTCSSSVKTGCEFQIYDVSNPTNPLFIGGSDSGTDDVVEDVFVSGRYAYLVKRADSGTCSSADKTGCEFQIYDVSNPTNPVYVGGADILDQHGYAVFVAGKYAYVGREAIGGTCSSTNNTGCEFQIYDISNPANPIFTGGTNTDDGVYGIFVSGRYTYTGDANGALRVFDISNPYAPTQVASVSAGNQINSVFVSGKYLYLGKNVNTGVCNFFTSTGCELQVWDISNPLSPDFKGGSDINPDNVSTDSTGLFISGRNAYLTKESNTGNCIFPDKAGCEFQIFDIGGIDVTSALIGSLETGSLQVRENAIFNNQLYVGGGLGVGPGGLYSQGMVGIGVSSGTPGLVVNMLGVGTGYTAPAAIFNGGNVGINLGIGSSTPGSTLFVGGNVGIGWTGNTFASMPGLGLSVFGNVGIGTTSPTYGLQVVGNVGIGQSLTVGSALQLQSYDCSGLGGGGKLTTDSAGRVVCAADAGGSGVTGSGSSGQVTFWDGASSVTGANTLFWNNELMRLGIGSSASANRLGVFGAVGIGASFAYYNAPENGLIVEGNVGLGTSSPIAPFHLWGAGFASNETPGAVFLNGNIGIGWTSPSQLFQINPTYVGTQLTNPLPFVVTSTGNVGVGTTAPRSALDILGGSLLQTPQNPIFVGGISDGDNGTRAVFIFGKYAYTGDNGGTFRIYDVTNPSSPSQIGTLSAGSGFDTVFVSGKYAYVGVNGGSGVCSSTTNTGCELQIYDISNPASPLFVGGADTSNNSVISVFVSGKYAYAGVTGVSGTCSSTTNTGCELQIYDISNPTSTRFVGGADTSGGSITSVFIAGKFAYIGDGNGNFRIYDVSNPTSPLQLSSTAVGSAINSVFVSGRYTYLGDTGDTLRIYDISNPYSPAQASTISAGNGAINSVFVSGRYTYLGRNSDNGTCNFLNSAAGNDGCELQVYDVSNPNNPLYAGGADNGGNDAGGNTDEIFVSGRYIYLGKVSNSDTCSSRINVGCEFQIYDIGGIDVTSAIIGSLEAGGLQVRESAIISNQLTVGGGLGIGPGGLMSQGMVGIGVSSGTVGLYVEMLGVGTGYTAPAAIFNGGNVGINLGIGASTPGSTLFVGGNVGIGWTGYTFASMPGLGLSVFGNVGIGTTTPTYGLHVVGNVGIGQSLTVGSALQLQSYDCSGLTGGGKLTADSAGRIVCQADAGGAGVTGSGSSGQVTFWDGGGTQVTGANSFYWNNELMRLGIGSSASANTLGVFGSMGIGSSFAYYNAPANGLIVEGNVGLGTSSPIAPFHLWGSGTTSAIFLNGNIGIGWTSPSQLFQINPTYVGTQLTNPLPFVVTSTGNVGVGTTAPRSALDILGGSLLQTPQNPTFVGGASDSGADANNNVFISGRYAYVVKSADTGTCSSTDDTGCEFKIYDVSNPTSPTFVRGADLGASSWDVFVSGRYAYMVNNDTAGNEFRIYDISNPSSPIEVGGADLGNSGLGVFVSGRYAYVVHGSVTGNEFRIYDISNPSSPIEVGGADLGNGGWGVFVSGRYAYVVTGTVTGNEFRIYDISNPSSPIEVGGVELGNFSRDVFVSGRYAYVVLDNDAGNEFRIYDISNPSSPTLVGGVELGTNGWGVFVSGRYAYVVTGTVTGNEFRIYDISNPSSPALVGGADLGDDGNEVFVSGRYAYMVKAANAGTCNAGTNVGCEFQIYDIGGIDVTSALIGSLESGSLQVRESAIISNQLTVGGGLGVGPGGLLSQGMVGIGVSSGTTGLYVEMLGVGTGYTAPAAIFNGGNVGINLGIGASTPGATLVVGGNVGIGWTGFTFASMPGLGLSVFGNVGIGTTTANYALDVVGNVGIGQSLTVGSALQLQNYNCSGLGGGGKLTTDSSGRVVCAADAGGGGVTGSGSSGQVTFFDGASSVTGANTLFWNNALMRLGVGSSASANRLGVFGSMGIGSSFAYYNAPTNGLIVEGNVGLGTSSPIASFHLSGSAIFQNGNIGIGWTSPSQLFQINPTYVGTQLTNPLPFTVTSQGNVGVGTTAPRSALDILGGSLLQTPQNPTFVGGLNTGNGMNSVFASGKYVYAGDGATLKIFDVTNPNSPVQISSISTTSTAQSVFISGKFAYVGTNSNAGTCSSTTSTGCELQIYDVSNPANPIFVGGADNGGNSTSVFVSGRYAYTVENGGVLRIYDISNPSRPLYIGGSSMNALTVNSIFVSGRYAYIARCFSGLPELCDDGEMGIYDISNPTNPILIGKTIIGYTSDTNSIFVSGRYAYVGDSGGTLRIIDVSNPYSPTQSSTITTGDAIQSVFVSGKYLYLGKVANAGVCNFFTSTGCEIQVYDISNPNNPLYVGGADNGGNNVGADKAIFVSGRYLYSGKAANSNTCNAINSEGCEFQIYDIGGIDVTSALIGSLEAGGLQVRENAFINNQLTVGGGLGIGPGGLYSQGMVGIGVSSGTVGLRVEMLGVGTGYTAPAAIFNGGNVGINLGIGASTPGSTLFVGGNVGIGWTANTFASMPGLGLSVFGNVGIGTTSPAYGLHVVGNVGIGQSLTVGSALQLSSYNCGVLTNGGKLTTDSSGRVVCQADAGGAGGITGTGTATQVAVWDGASSITGYSTFQYDSTNLVLEIGDTGTTPDSLDVDGEFTIGSTGTVASAGRIWTRSNGTTFRFNSDATTADYSEYIKQEDASEPGDVMILTPGTPGVGTDSPGVVRRSNSSYDENIIGVITTRGTSYNNPDDNRQSDPTYANVGMLGQVWVKVNLENGPIYTGDPLTSSSTQGEAMKATKTGRIIGRAMENYTSEVDPDSFEVSSTGAPPGQILIQVNVTWWEAEQFIERLDSGLLYLDGNLAIGGSPPGTEVSLAVEGSILATSNILSLGNVGIGTTNPLYGLDIIKDASSSASASIINLSQADNPDTSALKLGLGTPISGTSSNFIDFYAAVATPGAGPDSPGVRVGRIRLNDNKVAYESVGADFAEYFDALEETEDGDLVSLTMSHSGVAKSSIPYDQNLIGVVSHDAAFVGNADYTPGVGPLVPSEVEGDSPGVNKAIVGLLGQIKTKVSTINGDIKRGDYLTSSEIPGVAAKATRPGQVIGQALEDFSANTPGVGPLVPSEVEGDSPGVKQGLISVHVKSGFADPGNFFSSLTMDNEGNLIIPKLKVASLTIDSRGIEDSNLKIEDSRLITDSSSPSSTLDPQNTTIYSPSSTVQYYDLSGKIASLEERIAQLENTLDQNVIPADAGIQLTNSDNSNSDSLLDPLLQEDDNTATSSAALAQVNESSSSSILAQLDQLDLSPPDILLASGSATLTADLTVTSSAQILGSLTAYDAIIQNSLKSFGQTTLGDTLIAGNLTIDGTLSFSENTIDALSTLYLQKSLLSSSVDIFNGKITLEKDGTIKAKTIIVDQIKVNPDTSRGEGTILKGQINTLIENSYAAEDSIILITPVTADIALTQSLAVIDKKEGKFTVQLARPETFDITFDYLIVGIDKSTIQASGP